MTDIELNEKIKKRVCIQFKREPDIPLVIESAFSAFVVEYAQPMLRVMWDSLNGEIVINYYDLESITAYSVTTIPYKEREQ